MNFNELKKFYSEHYSLGYLNLPESDGHSPFERKLILISLVCYIVYKINTKLNLPDDFIKGLAIVCEDFAYQCHEFPTFGLEGKKILEEICSILKTYVPF